MNQEINELIKKTEQFYYFCKKRDICPNENIIDEYFKNLTEKERIYFICHAFYHFPINSHRQYVKQEIKISQVKNIWYNVVPKKMN